MKQPYQIPATDLEALCMTMAYVCHNNWNGSEPELHEINFFLALHPIAMNACAKAAKDFEEKAKPLLKDLDAFCGACLIPLLGLFAVTLSLNTEEEIQTKLLQDNRCREFFPYCLEAIHTLMEEDTGEHTEAIAEANRESETYFKGETK